MTTPSMYRVSVELSPFSRAGMSPDENGALRYDGLPTSLLEMLWAHVTASPDTEAVVEVGGERLTYRQLWDGAARVAGGLRDAGLQRGDRIAIRYPAGVDWVVAFWGAIMAGGIAVAVNTRSAAPEVDFVIEDCDARMDLSPDAPLPDGDPYVVQGLMGKDIAALFYTSGTTGNPKGVPTTHEAFLTNAESLVRCAGFPRDIGAELRTLINVPLFHVTGCNAQLIVASYLGGTAVIMPALDLPGLAVSLVSERITFVVSVPAVYALLLRRAEFTHADVIHVRWVGYGGSPIAPSLVDALQKTFPKAAVFNGYGMTETASLVTVLPDRDAFAHADSVGYAVPTTELAVMPFDEDSMTGELLVRGPNVTRGYWNRPEATAAAVVDGWLHTGDVVRVDDAGRVHLIDRIKDIIIRGGENISSVEVEHVLATAPGVVEAAVMAVPDDVMGEKVGAVLVGADEPIVVDDVLAHCAAQLADFKVPQYVIVLSEPLPRNPSGKVLKTQLRLAVHWGAPLR